jgi:hypothetical protein
MGTKTLLQLPAATVISQADVLHINQAGSDAQVTADAIAQYAQRLSQYAGTAVSISGAATISIAPARDQQVIANVGGSPYTIAFPSITALAIPMKVLVTYNGSSGTALTLSGLNNYGGSVNLYNGNDTVLVEAVQTGVGAYGWQAITFTTNDGVSTSAASYTVNVADLTRRINYTTGSSTCPLNLPAASSVLGRRYTISKSDSGTGQVTITPNGGDIISGFSTVPLTDQYDSACIYAAAAGIWILEVQPVVSTARKRAENKLPLMSYQFIGGNYQAPAAWSFTNEAAHFAWLCLDIADQVITTTHWALLVPAFRSQLLSYLDGQGGQVTAFITSTWQVSGGTTGTLVFASNSANSALFGMLAADQAIQGSYTNWRTITLASPIGNIPAGNFFITGVTAGTLTLTFTIPTSTNGGPTSTSAATVQLYPHRLADSESNPSTSARVLAILGRNLTSANSLTESVLGAVLMLRRGNQFQGHYQGVLSPMGNFIGTGTGASFSGTSAGAGLSTTGAPVTDGTNGTPNVGKTTHSDDVISHLYIWGGRYA